MESQHTPTISYNPPLHIYIDVLIAGHLNKSTTYIHDAPEPPYDRRCHRHQHSISQDITVRPMTVPRTHGLAGLVEDIPDADGGVPAAGHHQVGVGGRWAECHTVQGTPANQRK